MSWAKREEKGFPSGWWVPVGVGRWLLLGTAAVQAATPLVIDFGGSGTDPPVVPADYAFAIWGVIVLGCLASAAYGLPGRRAASPAYRAVHLRLSVVHLLFVAWLLAATSPAVWLTLPVFVAMLALTLTSLRRVLAATGADRRQRSVRWLLGGTLGIYAGWSTAAVWVNLATLLTDAGVSTLGLLGTAWQALVLVAATGTAVVLLDRLGGPLPYAAAVAWALAGIVVGTVMADAPGLTATAALGLLTVAAAVALTRRPVAA